MSYLVEGYLRNLPEGSEFDVSKVTSIMLAVSAPGEIAKLERIWDSQKQRNPLWVPPMRRHLSELNLKVKTSHLLSKISAEMARTPINQWLNRPLRLRFKLRPYRFINSEGIVISGASAQLEQLEFMG